MALKSYLWRSLALQCSTKIDNPGRFTLLFGTGGQASLKLDSNRGTGSWKVEVGGTESGQLTFSPIAATRFTRNERGWLVRFGEDELFEFPEALVFGV